MKKVEMIKEKKDFTAIIQNSPFFKNKYYTIYIRKRKDEKKYFGLAISKKTGIAVVRNKLKRQVRCIIDSIKETFPNGYDYIIMIKRNCVAISFNEMKENLIQLIKEKK